MRSMYKEYRSLATVQYEWYMYYNEITKWKDRRMDLIYYKLRDKNKLIFPFIMTV